MLHIGMIGPEYATAHTKLMAPLSGNSGWLAGPPEKAPEEEAPAAEEAIPAEEQAPVADPAGEVPAAAQGEEAEEGEAHD